MSTKRITLNIPEDKLIKAMRLVNLNQTDTICYALDELIAIKGQSNIKNFKGKIDLEFDIHSYRNKDKI